MEAMSDVSSVGGGGSPRKALQTRGAHPVRTRGPAQGAAALSIPAPRNPQIAQRQTSPDPAPTKRLFDPSRDDPLRFSAMSSSNRQSATPSIATSNTGYISASSTSDTRSLASSAFTLSSATSGTSVDSGPYQGKKSEPANVTPLVAELKRVYREISDMEKKLAAQHVAAEAIDEEPSRFQTTPALAVSPSQEEKWIRLVEAHKA
jgi:protein SMG6